MKQTVLLLGNPALYQPSELVQQSELDRLPELVQDLHDTLMDFRETYGAGRAIAAPQIGVMKRVIYLNIDHAVVLINPVLTPVGEEQMELLDDCMSFPGLLVKVRRFRRCRITYRDMDWKECVLELEGDLSELLQHEYDHLDGILATMRAVDERSLCFLSEKGKFLPTV